MARLTSVRPVAVELPRALGGGERVGDLVELPGEHLVERVQREADAVVGDAVLLVVVRADLLGAPAALHLAAPGRRQLRLLALALGLEEPAAQDAHRLVLVLQLALLVLAGDDEARGLVRDAHRGVGGVHRLPARSARAVTSISRSLGSMSTSTSSASGSTATVAALVWTRPWLSVAGHALHAVRARLVLEPRPRVVALHDERDVADSRPCRTAGGRAPRSSSGAARRSARTCGTGRRPRGCPPRRPRRRGSRRSRSCPSSGSRGTSSSRRPAVERRRARLPSSSISPPRYSRMSASVSAASSSRASRRSVSGVAVLAVRRRRPA